MHFGKRIYSVTMLNALRCRILYCAVFQLNKLVFGMFIYTFLYTNI